jgi:predicted  nucleic acid-binding Zn-ribbon protein
VQKEIVFSDLEQWIKKHMDSSFEEIKPQAISFRNKFQLIINSIKMVGKQLGEAQIKEDQVAQQFIPVINDAKNTLLTTIHRETSDKLMEINTFEDLLALRDRAKSLLTRLGETGGSHSRTIHSFFAKYAKVLKLELGILDKEMKRINELIDDYNEKTSTFGDCRQRIAKVSSALNVEKEFLMKQNEIRDELGSLTNKKAELERKIEDYKRTERYNQYLKDKEVMERAGNAINNILSELNAAFSRISRPLSKYSYELGLDKESNILMQSVMESPANLMADDKANNIMEILNKVKDAMQKGRIVTKNPERDVENINTLANNLHDYVKQYKDYYSNMQELRNKTSVIDNELERMYEELRKIRDYMQHKESSLNDYNQQVTNAKVTIKDELKKIAEIIEDATMNKVTITI